MNCKITILELMDYRSGIMSSQDRSKLKLHLESACPSCAANLGFLANLEPAMAAAIIPDTFSVPDRAVVTAKNIFRERHVAVRSVPSIVKIAQRIFNTQLQTSAFGARLASAQPLQSVYSVDEYVVDIWQEQNQNKLYCLMGSIQSNLGDIPSLPTGIIVESSQGTSVVGSIHGREFNVDDAPAGSYTIYLDFADFRIALEDVQVGS